MKLSHQGFSIVFTFLVLAIVAIAGLTGYLILSKGNKPGDSSIADNSTKEDPGTRDKTREEHAISLTSSLFSATKISKQDVPMSQSGLETINTGALTDPLTNKPYVFSADQTSMEVGEVVFLVDATCDNKISGSAGKGLIVATDKKSIALAIKLENGDFACESSL